MEKSNILKPSTLLPVAAAVLLMGVTCYYQGIWSERWGELPELSIYSRQLQEVPMTIGEWTGTDLGESTDRVKELSGSQGEFNRAYRNASGQEVRVMLMCARFRDIFSHSPDLCYPAAGFEMLNQPQHEVKQIGDTEAQFFTTTFRKSDPASGTHDERGYWTWTSDGTWLAPSNQRLTYAGEKALYKLYIFTTLPANAAESSQHDFTSDFIREFLPAVTTALRPGFELAKRARAGEEIVLPASDSSEAAGKAEAATPAVDGPAA